MGALRAERLVPVAADEEIRAALKADLPVASRVSPEGDLGPRGPDHGPRVEGPCARGVEPSVRRAALPDVPDAASDCRRHREHPHGGNRENRQERDQGENPRDVQERVAAGPRRRARRDPRAPRGEPAGRAEFAGEGRPTTTASEVRWRGGSRGPWHRGGTAFRRAAFRAEAALECRSASGADHFAVSNATTATV